MTTKKLFNTIAFFIVAVLSLAPFAFAEGDGDGDGGGSGGGDGGGYFDPCVFNPSICFPPQPQPVCGDGIQQSSNNEQCDDGNSNNYDSCNNNCQLTLCGDGKIQNPNGNGQHETCDDGNTNNNDGCDAYCQIEYECTSDADCHDGLYCNGVEYCDLEIYECKSGSPVQCSDGLFCDGQETCNENTDSCTSGNNPCNNGQSCNENNDQCINQCRNNADCNNGLFCDGQETCNQYTHTCQSGTPIQCNDGDFCNGEEYCDEYVNSCVYGDEPCNDDESCNEYTNMCEFNPYCGNGNLDFPEQCDDGNSQNGDGCSASCKVEECNSNYDCNDGLFCNGNEYCDLNTYICKSGTPVQCNDNSFCNGYETCNEQTDSCQSGTMPCNYDETCNEYYNVCEDNPYCGDGELDYGEECDDGNNNNGDGCSAYCTVEECNYDWECDNGLFCDGEEYCDTYTNTCEPGYEVECGPGAQCNEELNACTLLPFSVRITADQTKGPAALKVELGHDLTGGIPPFLLEWDVDYDGDIDIVDEGEIALEFLEPGTYIVYLQATDDIGRVAYDTITIYVTEENDRRNIILINHIAFDKEYYQPGDTVRTFLNFENIGDGDLDETRVIAMVPELGVRSNAIKPATINIDEQSSKMLTFELPANALPGEYWVLVTIDIDGDRRIKYRPITIVS